MFNGWPNCSMNPLIKANVLSSWPIICSSIFNLFSSIARNFSSLASCVVVTYSMAASNISSLALFFNFVISLMDSCLLLPSLREKMTLTTDLLSLLQAQQEHCPDVQLLSIVIGGSVACRVPRTASMSSK